MSDEAPRVVWTEELRAAITPAPPKVADAVDVAKRWRAAKDGFAAMATTFEKGLGNATADAARLAKEGAAVLAAEAPPDPTVSLEALGAALAMAAAFSAPMVEVLAATRGPVVAALAMLEAGRWTCARRYPAAWLALGEGLVFGHRELRRAAGDAEREGLLTFARGAWDRASVRVKIALAHATDDPELCAGAARAIATLPAGERLDVSPILVALREASLLEGTLARRQGAHPLVDAVEQLGVAALPALLAMWSRPIHDRLHLARATSLFAAPEVAVIFARELDKKTTRAIAGAWMHRFPEIAERALGGLAKGRSRLATLASEARASVERAGADLDEASIDELPEPLRRAPGTAPPPKRKPRVVKACPDFPRAETARVPPEIASRTRQAVALAQFQPAPPDELARWSELVRKGEQRLAWWFDRWRVPHDAVLALALEVGCLATDGHLPFQLVALFGDVAVPPLAAWLREARHWSVVQAYRDVLEVIDSHAVAAGLLSMQDTIVWSDACRWWDRHAEATIVGLVPIAAGPRRAGRATAERVLRRLARTHDGAIRAHASALGAPVRAAIDEVLDAPAACFGPKRPRPMPAAWRPKGFTRPRLRDDGRALPIAAVDAIGGMLALSKLGEPWDDLATVRAACDPRSLADLAWDVARAWETSGAKSKERWMVEAIAHLGDDEVVRRTTPAMRQPYVIDVLGAIASDAAAVELVTIDWRNAHETGRRLGTRTQIDAALANLARLRGLSVGALEDGLLPTLRRLDEPIELDYGARRFTVGFDERLEAYVVGPKGRLKQLPKAAKADDAEKVARAQAQWRELGEEVSAIADRRLASLERAMISGRAWTPAAFRRAWTEHALMRHVARGVVWRAGERCFRVAEDGSFAGVDDRALDLGEGELVRAPHPTDLSDAERAAWTRVLGDYEIVQPVTQLARPVVRASGASTKLATPAPVPFTDVHGRLRERGWAITWRDRVQVAVREAARVRARLEVDLVARGKDVVELVVRAKRDAEDADLAELAVDLSELAHDVGFG